MGRLGHLRCTERYPSLGTKLSSTRRQRQLNCTPDPTVVTEVAYPTDGALKSPAHKLNPILSSGRCSSGPPPPQFSHNQLQPEALGQCTGVRYLKSPSRSRALASGFSRLPQWARCTITKVHKTRRPRNDDASIQWPLLPNLISAHACAGGAVERDSDPIAVDRGDHP